MKSHTAKPLGIEEKVTALSACIKKEDKLSNISLYPKELEEDKTSPKARRKKYEH